MTISPTQAADQAHQATPFEVVMETSYDAIICKNIDGTIIDWNPQAEVLYGYTRQEMLGKSIETIFPEGQRNDLPVIMDKLRCGEVISRYETRRKHKNGTILDVSLTITPMKNELNQVVGALTITHDISARKREEALRSAFLVQASHELRTPVTAIRAYLHYLKRVCLKTGREDFLPRLQDMQNQLDQLTSIILNILDLSQLQIGNLKLGSETFELQPLVHKLVEMFELTHPDYLIHVTSSLSGAVYGDPNRISQVLVNLLNNAIKFSPHNNEIEIILESVGNEAWISVRDHGIGISPDQMDKIFQRFYKTSDTSSTAPSGLRIGLYICAEIIKLHGSQLRVESEEGKGSTFLFTLPMQTNQAKCMVDSVFFL